MHITIRACFLCFFYNPYMSLFNSKNFSFIIIGSTSIGAITPVLRLALVVVRATSCSLQAVGTFIAPATVAICYTLHAASVFIACVALRALCIAGGWDILWQRTRPRIIVEFTREAFDTVIQWFQSTACIKSPNLFHSMVQGLL